MIRRNNHRRYFEELSDNDFKIIVKRAKRLLEHVRTEAIVLSQVRKQLNPDGSPAKLLYNVYKIADSIVDEYEAFKKYNDIIKSTVHIGKVPTMHKLNARNPMKELNRAIDNLWDFSMEEGELSQALSDSYEYPADREYTDDEILREVYIGTTGIYECANRIIEVFDILMPGLGYNRLI